MRVLVLCLAAAAAGCGSHKYYAVTPDPPRDAAARGPAATESLSSFMAKVREISAAAAPRVRPAVATLETTDPSLAETLLRAALEPTPAHLREVAEQYRRLKVFDQAHHYLNRARALAPRDADTYDSLARVWRDAGQPHLGLADAHRAVYFGSTSAAAHNTRGTVLQAMGRRTDARRAYERAAALDPLAAYAHNNICYAWVLEGDGPRALQACRRALALDPTSAVTLNNAGLAHALTGDMDGARTAFGAAGNAAAAHFNSGIVYLATRQWERASIAFRDALAADPGLRGAGARARQAESMLGGATP